MLDSIMRAYGVDLEALGERHHDTLETNRDASDTSTLQALATAALLHAKSDSIGPLCTVMRLAWAVGRESGRAEPDLSVFDDALQDVEL